MRSVLALIVIGLLTAFALLILLFVA